MKLQIRDSAKEEDKIGKVWLEQGSNESIYLVWDELGAFTDGMAKTIAKLYIKEGKVFIYLVGYSGVEQDK